MTIFLEHALVQQNIAVHGWGTWYVVPPFVLSQVTYLSAHLSVGFYKLSLFLIQTCNNSDCLYLHDIGSQEDSFTKDETISAYTRYYSPSKFAWTLKSRSLSIKRWLGVVIEPLGLINVYLTTTYIINHSVDRICVVVDVRSH